MTRDPEDAAAAAHARSAGAADAAGLVLSKTSGPDEPSGSFLLSTHPSDVVLARLGRLRRNVLAAANLHAVAEAGFRAPRAWMVTLTYRGVHDWQPRHIATALRAYRKWCKRHGVPCRYEWVAELQSRGAMHYHLIAWLPARLGMPKWDKRGWWPHGLTQSARARSGAGYLAKYLSKMGEYHRFPKGARLYGVGGLDEWARKVRAWWNLPEWARRLGGVGDIARRACGLVVRATGEVLAAVWSVRRVPGGLEVRRLRPLPPRWHDGTYSTWPRVVTP